MENPSTQINKKASIIAIYNHKGGVGKTTLSMDLSWGMALKGINVLVVDLDPQFTLSVAMLGYQVLDMEDDWYDYIRDKHTIFDAVDAGSNLLPTVEILRSYPATEQSQDDSTETQEEEEDDDDEVLPLPFRDSQESLKEEIRRRTAKRVKMYCEEESKAKRIKKKGSQFSKLSICLGDEKMSTYEERLSGHHSGYKSQQPFEEILRLEDLVRRTAYEHGFDAVILDLSPGFGAISRNVLGFCDYLITPCATDVYSINALQTLAIRIPRDILSPEEEFSQYSIIKYINMIKKKKAEMDGLEPEVREGPHFAYLGYAVKFVPKGKSFTDKMRRLDGAAAALAEAMALEYANDAEIEFQYNVVSFKDYTSVGQLSQDIGIPAGLTTAKLEKAFKTETKTVPTRFGEFNNCIEKLVDDVSVLCDLPKTRKLNETVVEIQKFGKVSKDDLEIISSCLRY